MLYFIYSLLIDGIVYEYKYKISIDRRHRAQVKREDE